MIGALVGTSVALGAGVMVGIVVGGARATTGKHPQPRAIIAKAALV
jgi:hypothetical protein